MALCPPLSMTHSLNSLPWCLNLKLSQNCRPRPVHLACLHLVRSRHRLLR